MQWFYSEGYDYGGGLPGEPREIHGFVLRKPAAIRDRLVTSGVAGSSDFHRPTAVTEDELRDVHTPDLIARLHDPSAVATAIELPEAAFLPPQILWSAVVAPQCSRPVEHARRCALPPTVSGQSTSPVGFTTLAAISLTASAW